MEDENGYVPLFSFGCFRHLCVSKHQRSQRTLQTLYFCSILPHNLEILRLSRRPPILKA
uniref:Ovule protein n=1 Tax=Heterorhabditis bacteriophora TaxID=37862 RepID=A0A1I7WYN7_HETBA